MNSFWEGLGIALVILALAVGLHSCMNTERPMIGPNGTFISIGNLGEK